MNGLSHLAVLGVLYPQPLQLSRGSTYTPLDLVQQVAHVFEGVPQRFFTARVALQRLEAEVVCWLDAGIGLQNRSLFVTTQERSMSYLWFHPMNSRVMNAVEVDAEVRMPVAWSTGSRGPSDRHAASSYLRGIAWDSRGRLVVPKNGVVGQPSVEDASAVPAGPAASDGGALCILSD